MKKASGFQLPASSAPRVMRGFGVELELLSLKIASSLSQADCRSRQGCDTRVEAVRIHQPTLELSVCAGSRKPEAGSWKREAGSGKLEAGSGKLEAGSGKREAGS